MIMPDYGTAAAFRTYHTARGRDVSDMDDAEIEADILVASEWLDGKYRSLFRGTKVGMRAQVREWPRVGVTDANGYAVASDSVPVEIENATYEAAWINNQAPGSLSVSYTPPRYKRASVDGAVSVEYTMYNSAADAQTQFTAIDYILAPIVACYGGNVSSILSGPATRA
jgi:hypothetical protein